VLVLIPPIPELLSNDATAVLVAGDATEAADGVLVAAEDATGVYDEITAGADGELATDTGLLLGGEPASKHVGLPLIYPDEFDPECVAFHAADAEAFMLLHPHSTETASFAIRFPDASRDEPKTVKATIDNRTYRYPAGANDSA
jgi:hypothetical protein